MSPRVRPVPDALQAVLDRLESGEKVGVRRADEHVEMGLTGFLGAQEQVEHPVFAPLRLADRAALEPVPNVPVVNERLEFLQNLDTQRRGSALCGGRPPGH